MNNWAIKLLGLGFLFSLHAHSVSVNFGGNFRSDGDYYTNLTQGYQGDFSKKQFIRGRLLVEPNLVVDDQF